MTTTATIICPDCRNENEFERIYCHDCGAKLDRSRVKKEAIVVEEKPEEIQAFFIYLIFYFFILP